MPFPEKVKLEAKRKSHFACVICHQPFVEVHHILPEADDGPDDLDNAAPLCGSCHDLFGANPVKRKQIREMRDFWWEICEKKPANPDLITFNEKLDAIQQQMSENAIKLASQQTAPKFRGEWSPNETYSFSDMVIISMGSNAGTFIYVNSIPSAGKAPYWGGGYWVQLPSGGGNVWL